jgi:hypothetical protein
MPKLLLSMDFGVKLTIVESAMNKNFASKDCFKHDAHEKRKAMRTMQDHFAKRSTQEFTSNLRPESRPKSSRKPALFSNKRTNLPSRSSSVHKKSLGPREPIGTTRSGASIEVNSMFFINMSSYHHSQ